MMNHFVISNWYSEIPERNIDNGNINTHVKILKYYPGASLTGQVTLSDNGELSGVRLLVERDAFSGENGDQDDETFDLDRLCGRQR